MLRRANSQNYHTKDSQCAALSCILQLLLREARAQPPNLVNFLLIQDSGGSTETYDPMSSAK